jgi:hypothetical protein
VRQFEHPNMNGFSCRVCNTNTDAPVVLVPIAGTESGGICEAEQVHSECYKLFCKMRGVAVDIIGTTSNEH